MNAARFRVSAGLALALLLTTGGLLAQRGGRGGAAPAQPLQFRALGPVDGGGRVCCVVGIPGQPNVYYIGGGGGGVWKTTDGGFSWKPIFEHYTTESIGALALAPSNPNLLWVGTGESNVRNDVIDGHGLFFSPDAGQTFTEVGAQYFHHAGQISKIVINPDNANEVWVGVLGHAFGPNPDRGVYHTTDGGATWQKTLFVDENTGAIDLSMQPGNPRVLVAAMWQTVRHPWGLDDGGPGSGMYKSTDGGQTWKKLSRGLPAGPYGRIAVEFAPSQPDRLYAEIQAKRGVFWRSDDAGESWSLVSDDYQLNSRPFYFSRFEVMPNDPDKIFFLSVRMSYSADGGKTATAAGTTLHSDHHALWMDPTNPSRMIEGDDGGVNFSHDAGLHWLHTANVALEEGYSIHVDNDTPYHICDGLQDNGGWCGPSQAAARPSDWRMVVGGDGEYVVPAPSDANILYADSQEGDVQRTDFATGVSANVKPLNTATSGETNFVYAMPARFNWTTPIEVDANDPNTVYIGANRLYKSTNGGHDWTAISPDLTRNDKSKQQASGGPIDLDMTGAETADTILSISLSPTDKDTIWVGTDDGYVQVTHDGGKTWTNTSNNIAGLPEWGRLQEIECSPFDPNTAYVAYDRHEMDDDKPYVYKTHDSGKTWTAINAGLPEDYSATVVREDPNHKGLLMLGTYSGLYKSTDDGATWTQVHSGLPVTVVYDIKFVKASHDLIVGTHGRGIYVMNDITPWEQMADTQVADAPFTLFPILDAYRYTRAGGGGGGLNQDPFAVRVPQPPQGAVIQYNLKTAIRSPRPAAPQPVDPEQAQMAAMAAQFGFALPTTSTGPVTVEVADAQGQHVATLHGPARAGVNEVVWSGNFDPSPVKAPPSNGRGGGGFFGGAGQGLRALPGRYKVTVTAPGFPAQTQWVNLKEDPRVKVDMAALEATLKAGQAMQPDIDAMNRMLDGLTSLEQQLGAVQKNLAVYKGQGDYDTMLTQAGALRKKAVTLLDKFNPAPRHEDYGGITEFAAEFNGIFRRVSGGVNEMPHAQDLRDWAQDRVKLQGYLAEYNALVKTDVVAFNKLALAHNGVTLVAGGPVTLPAAPAVLTAAGPSLNP
ncbi:MAG TPA: hypothetical protein VN515_01195 [Terriglobales bacterium]|nr:hypothetical protein [Terriglobales bacterium]